MSKKITVVVFLVLTVMLLTSCGGAIPLPQLDPVKDGEEIAVMETTMGTIKLRFFPKYAPKAVENFITHAKDGYYDGVIFHRVIKDFMIQGGDPQGTGRGGESIWGGVFEIETTPSLRHIRGALAMAHGAYDKNTNGSQFYIVQKDSLYSGYKSDFQTLMGTQGSTLDKVQIGGEIYNNIRVSKYFPTALLQKYISDGGVPDLDLDYTVFGQVIEGMDVVDSIASVPTEQANAEKKDRPFEDIVILSITFEKYKP